MRLLTKDLTQTATPIEFYCKEIENLAIVKNNEKNNTVQKLWSLRNFNHDTRTYKEILIYF